MTKRLSSCRAMAGSAIEVRRDHSLSDAAAFMPRCLAASIAEVEDILPIRPPNPKPGPVGIVGLVGNASALGLIALINFTALISLNLAVINLIPFPALDGGRLLFLAIETVKGSPIKPQVANVFNLVGFALLILLMFVVTYNDILRLVG